MGKTLQTKKRILSLLRKREMTATELSDELGLSTATISQHLEELQGMGTVEKVENEHFKKLKYYRIKREVNMNMAKYVIGALVIIAVLGGIYLYIGKMKTSPYTNATVPSRSTSTATNSTINSTIPITPGGVGGAFACPLITYRLNGTISNYSGFSLHYLNYSGGEVADYVIGDGSIGRLYASEFVNGVIRQPENSTLSFTTNRTHYAILTQVNRSFNSSSPGVSVSISPDTYNAINQTYVNATVTITTNQTAPYMTYWLRIDGPCQGGVGPVLVTVGSKPYSGNLTVSVAPYA